MEKVCPKMADKKPPRKIIPVFCEQSLPKLKPWNDTWKTLLDFSPVQEHGSPEPAHQHSRPLHQPFFQSAHPGRKMGADKNKENIPPPPSTQPRQPASSPLFDDAPGGSKVSIIASTQHINKLKVKYLCFPQ